MVKLSVSKAAKILGISRFEIQEQINNGKLQTHEGYVTTDSLKLAYPHTNLDSEQDKHIHKMQKIKKDAVSKSAAVDNMQSDNDKMWVSMVEKLKTKLYQEQLKNQHYEMVFEALNRRLQALEKCCHSQDKEALNKLQSWIDSNLVKINS